MAFNHCGIVNQRSLPVISLVLQIYDKNALYLLTHYILDIFRESQTKTFA